MDEIYRKELNKAFESHYLVSSLPGMRIGMVITLVMFFLFALFNRIFFPDSPEQQYYQRFWLISPVMVLSVVVTYIRALKSYLYQIFVILNLFIALAIFYLGISSSQDDAGYSYFYSWVMLVVTGLFVFYRMPFRTLSFIGMVQVISFAAATVVNGTFANNPFLYVNTLFFVISIYSIGFMMAYMFRQINYREFLHQRVISENNRKLTEEINERKQAVIALQQSEKQYHNTLDSIPDWIHVVDRHFRIVVINSSLREGHRMAGITEDVAGSHLLEIYPFLTDQTIKELRQVFESGEPLVSEMKMVIAEQVHYMENRKVPIFRNGEVVQVLTILRDRSKEKEVEELKQKNAEQKEIMLREIHHRVKNNLAIVISLLALQGRNNPDKALQRIIHDIEMRIRSMALIHEHLYRSENLDRIPLADYLQTLATIITGTFSGHRVHLELDLEPIDVNIETALPIGLITNELLSNSFKYAFPGEHEGVIGITLKKQAQEGLILQISDNGVGLPEGFSFHSDKSLGMFIVRLLVEQLDGTVDIKGTQGTSFALRFPQFIRKQPKTTFNYEK